MISYLILFVILFPIIMGVANCFIFKGKDKARDIVAIMISIIEVIAMVILAINYPASISIIGLEFKVDGFRAIYSLIATFMWMCTVMFSKEYMHHYDHKDRYYLFYLLTLGATVAVFLSNTLWTTFIFFEMMSLCSFVWVIHDQKEESIKAALTYLAIAIVSGMILLMGIFMLNGETNTLNFDELRVICEHGVNKRTFIAGILLLLGFGAKAGMFPLQIWLPKAHPVAPAPASALLSGILTKTGVYGIIVCVIYIFPSYKLFSIVLLVLALITMLLGAILAVFSVNFKRTLACSSMSQIGFILTGLSMLIFLGEENALAFEGAFLHMVNHSLIKLSLFMIAGVIVMNIHKLNLNEIKGFGRKKYFLMICYILAALGIMGIPLFNGYISKTLIHESIVEFSLELEGTAYYLIKAAEYVFLFSGGLTIAYMIKLFVCVFIEKNNDEQVQKAYDEKKPYMNWLSTLVIGLSSFILPFLGFIPKLTSNNLLKIANDFFKVEHLHFVNYFSLENLKGALISLLIGLLVYFVFIRLVLIKKNENNQKEYVDLWPKWLDMENLIYRPLLLGWEKPLYKGVSFIVNKIKVLFSKWPYIIKGIEYLIGKVKLLFKYLYIGLIVIMKMLSESLDAFIYVLRRYVFRQTRYVFNPSPLTFKLGKQLDKLTKKKKDYYANILLERKLIVKTVYDTLNSTFAFDLLMACIGIVSILLIIIL